MPYDKTNKLSLTNVKTCPIQHQHSKVCGNPRDKILCPARFFDFYFSKCHPSSTRFFGKTATENQKAEFKQQGLGDIWFKNSHDGETNSVVGIGNIRTMGKSVAKIAGFDSWEKCTNHGNRAYAFTKMIEAGAPLEDRMVFMHHGSANSQQPYAGTSTKREVNRQLALRANVDDNLKPPARPRQEAVVPTLVAKGTNGFQMGGGPSSLSTSTVSDPPNVEVPEWEEFQAFKAMKAAGRAVSKCCCSGSTAIVGIASTSNAGSATSSVDSTSCVDG